jgi:pSer/pThr/pTyr-binding forkhead associated (FHA) protein
MSTFDYPTPNGSGKTHSIAPEELIFKTFQVRSDIGRQTKHPGGNTPFSSDTQVTVILPELGISVALESLSRGVLGRIDPNSADDPDFDLTAYEAQEKGVSRRHAALCRAQDTLLIVDLDSLNGTYINGHRIAANQAYPLHDGDEVRLARLVILISFQPKED